MNGKNVTLSPPASDVGARTFSPLRQYCMTAGQRNARLPVALLEMSAMPSDGAVASSCPLNIAPAGVGNTVGFALENTFTPFPRRSFVRSAGPIVSGETDTLPAPYAFTVPAT